MQSILRDFIKKGKYPSPLKITKIPISKEEECNMAKDENKTKPQLIEIIEENISNLPDEQKHFFETQKSSLKIKYAKKEVLIEFLNTIRDEMKEHIVTDETSD